MAPSRMRGLSVFIGDTRNCLPCRAMAADLCRISRGFRREYGTLEDAGSLPRHQRHPQPSEQGAGETLRRQEARRRLHPLQEREGINPLLWKEVDSRSVGIRNSAVDYRVLMVLKFLKQEGHGAYLVGGCVRDLLLHKPPKDFDVVTTASLKQVRKTFYKTITVGRIFPVCHVYIKGTCIEVSSFDTVSKKSSHGQQKVTSQVCATCDPDDIVRWKNCMTRDFTINSLLYDPYANKIYDYVNGINDIKTLKVRTVAPAHMSFTEDCARILRGIRIAARLGLDFSKETGAAMLELSSSIFSLSKARFLMEMNYMLAYGAAVPSILLLQRFKLLEILLPAQAIYIAQQEAREAGQGASLLMVLFSGLDKLLGADHPSDCKLWLGLLSIHLALMQWPQNTLTLGTFSSILYHRDRIKAIDFVKVNAYKFTSCFPEIMEASGAKADSTLLEDASHFASLVKSALTSLTCPHKLKKALEIFQPSSTFSGMVFVSESMARKVAHLFDIFFPETCSAFSAREIYSIDYELLKKGDLNETGFVLGKVILDALSNSGKKDKIHDTVEHAEGKPKMHQVLEKDRRGMSSDIKKTNLKNICTELEQNLAISQGTERELEGSNEKQIIPLQKGRRGKSTKKHETPQEKKVHLEKELKHMKEGATQRTYSSELTSNKLNQMISGAEQEGGNTPSEKGKNQHYSGCGFKVKNKKTSKFNRIGRNIANGIKQEGHHADPDKNSDRLQEVTGGRKQDKLSSVFR